jgi:hypothetical protein
MTASWTPPSTITGFGDEALPSDFAYGGWLPPRSQRSRIADPNMPWSVAYGPARGYLWAGIDERLIALAIDAVIIALAFGLVGLVEWRYGPGTEQTAAAATGWMAFVGLYQPIAWWILRATPGQLARHLRVVKAKDGGRLWPHRAIWRFALQLVMVLVLVALTLVALPLAWIAGVASGGIERLWGSDDPRGRTIWDRAAGSVVVRRR